MSNIEVERAESRLSKTIVRVTNFGERVDMLRTKLTLTNNILMGVDDTPEQSNPEAVAGSGFIGILEDSLDMLDEKISSVQCEINRLCDSGII